MFTVNEGDAVAVFNINDPVHPEFLQILKTGDAPEGVLMINAEDSPIEKTLLVISSEDDGVIKIYSPR